LTYLGIFIVELEQLEGARLLQRTIQIPHLSVDLGYDGVVGQTFADAAGDLVGCGAPRLGLNFLPVRKGDLDGLGDLRGQELVGLGFQPVPHGDTLGEERRRGVQLADLAGTDLGLLSLGLVPL
jgi:hypothetical protein